ncbi:hypothetical protein CsSME_00025829 [Camellia sinensis var. sinensis]
MTLKLWLSMILLLMLTTWLTCLSMILHMESLRGPSRSWMGRLWRSMGSRLKFQAKGTLQRFLGVIMGLSMWLNLLGLSQQLTKLQHTRRVVPRRW